MTELIVGKFYKHLNERVEFLAHRGDKYIFCFRDGHTTVFRKDSVDILITPWEEEKPPVIADVYINIYKWGLGGETHASPELAERATHHNLGKDYVGVFHIRYDSSKPLKERITVIED